jgi:hypothetical protein
MSGTTTLPSPAPPTGDGDANNDPPASPGGGVTPPPPTGGLDIAAIANGRQPFVQTYDHSHFGDHNFVSSGDHNFVS